ncbi:MAG: ABC transporter permease [Gemmatimonadales bacterium]|nr:ABC transporter permease [Gemmatimonadales bacterium]MDQ3428294.1 ABC transporter permease [Gemmatimonadota bacterium]
MQVGETVSVAFQSIRANMLRSVLTMLGIIIGVGAVITMVALGSGAQKAVEKRIEALGANVLTVFAGQANRGGIRTTDRTILSTDDYAALVRDGRLLKAVVPEMQQQLQVEYGNQNLNVSVIGTTANYVEVRNYAVPYGRMFTQGDDGARQRYAVLGAALPGMLGGNPAAMIRQTILVRGIPFEILGVLSEKGSGAGWSNPDEQILIPLQTAKYRVFGSDRVRSMSVQVADGVPLEQGMVDLERILRREHRIRPGAENDFTIRNQRDILATQQQATQVFTTLLASIAAVSLLVGGIGIMNIMLVSVTERTREIGVRKALGATRNDILLQFLIEALALCLVGGLLGVLLGAGTAVALSRLMQWNTLISPLAVMVAFGFSALVGLFFGLWPARRAARLDPITALRYE